MSASNAPSAANTTLRLLALCLATGDQRDGIGDSIPQDVWESLHDEGLVETLRDITGDGFTNTTKDGLRVLLDVIDKEAAT